MTAINGKPVATDGPGGLPDPRMAVAQAVYTAMMDEGDPAFDEVEAEDLTDILKLTENYLNAHLNFLSANGFRVVPPGAVAKPASEPEAMAMLKAAKAFFDGQKRKGKLMGSAAEKPKLILPPGVH